MKLDVFLLDCLKHLGFGTYLEEDLLNVLIEVLKNRISNLKILELKNKNQNKKEDISPKIKTTQELFKNTIQKKKEFKEFRDKKKRYIEQSNNLAKIVFFGLKIPEKEIQEKLIDISNSSLANYKYNTYNAFREKLKEKMK